MAGRPTSDPLYVAARHVLLDGLEALGEQRRAAILVGAHAVYLRVGEGDLATTPHTTDADLALDPSLLGGVPGSERFRAATAATAASPNLDGVSCGQRPSAGCRCYATLSGLMRSTSAWMA